MMEVIWLYQIYRLIREDPEQLRAIVYKDAWLKFWNWAEKLQPEENKPLIQRKEEKKA